MKRNNGAEMDLIRGMSLFVAVAKSGSFVAAAEQEGLSPSALSRQIGGLEDHLGARLLHRTTRRVALTGAGQEYLERAEAILADVAEAEASVHSERLRPTGRLRISAPLSFGIAGLSPVLSEFHALYPELELDIDLTDRTVDLAHEGIDVGLRIASAPAPNLIPRRLMGIDVIVVAAPSFLAREGTPETPSDLSAMPTLGYSLLAMGRELQFTSGDKTEVVRINPKVRATNGELLRDMAIAGYGVTVQPKFLFEDALARGDLVHVLPDWSAGSFNLYAVYLSRAYQPAKVRAFIDHLVQSLAA